MVHVLNGGLKKWIKEKRKITKDLKNIEISEYKGSENKELIKNIKMIDQNIDTQEFKVIDARSRERFEGKTTRAKRGFTKW